MTWRRCVKESLRSLDESSIKHFTAVLFLGLAALVHPSQASTEELYQQFSLSGDSLTSAPPDAKVSEPRAVTAKYGFKIAKDFMPYMGTGLAYTYQPDIKTGDMTKLKTGVAAQFGFNYLLGINTTLKFDYKYLAVSTEQPRGDSRTAPQSLGIGLDIKF
jgi:opacity protein-like surface antigen